MNRNPRYTSAAPALLLVSALCAACNAASDEDAAGPSYAADGGAQSFPDSRGKAAPGAGAPAADAGAAAIDPLPAEREERQEFEAPRAGGRFVYVANSRRDTVAVIDSMGLGIRTVPVGDTPGFLATVPGKDVALVINLGTHDVNILRTDAAGATEVSRVPVVPGANRLSVANDGAHAVAWYDSSRRGTSGNFQEVSVIALAPGGDAAIDMTVGFRPTEVVFAADGSASFVITEDGISVIRFADVKAPQVAPFVRLGDAGPGMPEPRDVAVTSDGRYAVARREGGSRVMLVDLKAAGSNAVTTVDLGSAVTDLDLAPSGAFVLAVLRAENTVVRLPIPAGFADETARVRRVFDGEVVGSASLSPDGSTAVLYTTAANPPVERVVIADLVGGGAPLGVRLKKAVRAVTVAPDGRTAVVLHTKVAGDPKASNLEDEAVIDRSFGYTVVDLKSGFAKLQLTPADVSSMAVTPDGSRAFLVVRDATSVRLVQRITLASFIVDEFALGSPPLSIAVLGEGARRAFVSQEHPEGRISFIHWDTRDVESVTGFELNGRIVQ